MKKLKIYLLSMLALAAFLACDDYLTLYPDNAQTTDQYWNTKGDVEKVIASGYVKLRDNVHYMFLWGEARGTGIDFMNIADKEPKAGFEVRQLLTKQDNLLCDWSKMYEVINMANSVLKYAPSVTEKDPSFTVQEMNGYFAEAYFLRSLAYFYLVRTFKDVPLVLQPYVNDDEKFDLAQSSEETILAKIAEDLENVLASGAAKEFYPETDVDNPRNSKGRATKWSIYALLADIYLWQGNYDKCINACTQIIGSGRVGLIGGDLWFTNYFPGNSNESIFEIQYDYNALERQTNSFIDWFDYAKKGYYVVSNNTIMFLSETASLGDVRFSGTVDGVSGGTYGIKLWKYLGTLPYTSGANPVRNATNQNDQNFIIYRLAEIYLMRAEAYVMKGDAASYALAAADVTRVRERAGIVQLFTFPSNELEALHLILSERVREFCGEGKSWFDLLRIARRNNYSYKEYMIWQVLSTLSPGQYSVTRAKLLDSGSHYLPVSKKEMDANRLLEQNSYYTNLGYGRK
ncbi:MAG: RagB/SusD family nutrient uptake outer membrane protein [Bacteroidales bacterium]|jgi:hypothetical protein|nr:RagB/SusD family nutrient uptake outer membrane protein [Bacteroidales bacterium]